MGLVMAMKSLASLEWWFLAQDRNLSGHLLTKQEGINEPETISCTVVVVYSSSEIFFMFT